MQMFRKSMSRLLAFAADRSGAVASEDAVALSLAMLGSLIAFAAVGVMPADVVNFALDSLGGALDLVS